MAGKPNIHGDTGTDGGFYPRLWKALCEGNDGTFVSDGNDPVREAAGEQGEALAGQCKQCADAVNWVPT